MRRCVLSAASVAHTPGWMRSPLDRSDRALPVGRRQQRVRAVMGAARPVPVPAQLPQAVRPGSCRGGWLRALVPWLVLGLVALAATALVLAGLSLGTVVEEMARPFLALAGLALALAWAVRTAWGAA